VHWDIIDEATAASWKTQAEKPIVSLETALYHSTPHPSPLTPHAPSAGQIIRQRRSAVSFDGKTSITTTTFFRMMQRVVSRPDLPQLDRPMPWDVWPYDPAIHLMLFVHRVEGLTPGLYFLARDPQKLSHPAMHESGADLGSGPVVRRTYRSIGCLKATPGNSPPR
jgi:hypothetical protein